MRNKTIARVIAMIAIAACWVGCGSGSSGGGTSGDGLSQSESIALSSQISEAVVNGMNSADYSAMVIEGLQDEMLNTVQCNDAGCTINVPLTFTTNCTAGGRMELSGSITGSTDSNGTGVLQIGATQTITDWQCITGYIVNGDPYISLSGTFSFINGSPSTQQSLTISGGFKWGTTAADSCQISLSTNFNTTGGGRTTGTVCGYSVDYTF